MSGGNLFEGDWSFNICWLLPGCGSECFRTNCQSDIPSIAEEFEAFTDYNPPNQLERLATCFGRKFVSREWHFNICWINAGVHFRLFST